MDPLVTIVLPVYNGAQWISKAIESALAQSFADFELIIINDASKDASEEIALQWAARDPRIRYVKNEHNMGIQKTRNISLELAGGEYIAEIDQDDQWLDRDKLKKQIEFLQNHKGYVLIGTGAIMVDESGRELARYLMPETDEEIRKKILRANRFIHSSVVYRKEAVKKIGGYTVEKMSEDHDLWLRLGRTGKFTNLQEYSTQYLFSPGGYNSQNKILRLRQNLLFAEEHKDFYPHYYYALIIGWTKIFFTPIFNRMPTKLKGVFLKIHKKI
ncbi:MAG: hypothetical protein JWM92_585 [Candidatus Nomurabacteria bacterium]|nr:hypothetical protein [Candidatus Nomurabacteria bacterium]